MTGSVLSAAAVVVAGIQLQVSRATAEQSRKDLRTDRQIDFQQSVIMDIAVEYEQMARGTTYQLDVALPHIIAARLQVLPAQMLPVLRRLVGLPVPQTVHERVEKLLRAATAAGVSDTVTPWGRASVLRDEIRAEIRNAIDELTEERP